MRSSLILASLLSATATASAIPVVDTTAPAAKSHFRSLTPRVTPYATTANELTDGTPCKNVTLIYARGTTQEGNLGCDTDVGPLMMNALAALIGADKLAVQGVDYDADITGFLGNFFNMDEEGAQTMADLVAQANTQCPQTKLVLSGYSQGGQVVHDAADIFADNTAAIAQIAAVMLFGDPNAEDVLRNISQDKVTVICHDGDKICEGSAIVTPEHINYQDDAQEAARIIAAMVMGNATMKA